MTDFYKDKSVLVIGGAGFCGLHLVKTLLYAGANVTVLDDLSRGKMADVEPLKVNSNFTFHYGDCSREGTCRDVFKDQQYIFNLAAWVAGVDYNQRNQAEMYYKNWLTQMTPFRVAHEYGVERFLSVSSVCVYAPGWNAPCVEPNGFRGEPVTANLGYSLSKRNGERMAIWYAEAGLHTVRVRPSNLYGEGDYFDERAHVIPALIKKALNDDKIVVNGSGRERREFLYVTDAAEGMMAALERGDSGEVYNLGTDGLTCVSIGELVRMIRTSVGCYDKTIMFEHRFDSGDNARWSDAHLANERLDWRYKINLATGLEKTIRWYKEKNDGNTQSD